MSSSKVSGYKDKVVGASKKAVGSVASERLRTEGEAQKLQGQAEIDNAKLHNQAEAAHDQISGVAKQGTGALFGDASLNNEGRVERLGGKHKAARNQL